MAVGIDCNGESYGLVIDSVGEVLKLAAETREPMPVNLDEPADARAPASTGWKTSCSSCSMSTGCSI